MAIASVYEWSGALAQNGVVTQAPRGRYLRVQNVDFTSGATAMTNAIGADCGLLGFVADADCYWVGGASPVADSTCGMLPAGVFMFYGPENVHKISFIPKG